MPNFFAYFMLCAWPVIAYFIYRRADSVTATFFTIVGGALLLPVNVNIDFPLIPAFDKQTIPALAALLCLILVKKESISLLPKPKVAKLLVITLIVSPFFTVVTNGEPYFNGAYWIQGMTLYDSVSVLMRQYLLLLPFIIASQLIKSQNDFYKVCKLMVISGLFYSVLALIEVRLSPQLHTWVYGFFPHSFNQQVRFGGFRPVVFLGHGLLVGIYMFACFTAACVLWKSRIQVFKGISPVYIALYLLFCLIIFKAVGAILFGFFILALVLIGRTKLTRLSTKIITFCVLFYPLLCILMIFPHEAIVNFFLAYDVDRAHSLNFRFFHETLLIQHAQDKLLFGWGSWGRNRLMGSVTDGRWIIEFGQFGLLGFIAIFGLAIYSIHRILKTSIHFANAVSFSIGLFACAMSLIMVDQIVNDSLDSWVWFLLGAGYFTVVNFKQERENR
ncbi:hypothetical protein AAEU29_03595 [Pseudoalteromonas sp. SSM20]|uniref:hypothetical protein n=1 Tax=Pseudoalteromonas sp. SSM20 TaxID=3139394 RepID=UPI003BA8B527